MASYINFLLSLLLSASPVAPAVDATVALAVIPDVPFYSQFKDIHSDEWRKLGCGIASLAMIINFYEPGAVSPDTLLGEGVSAGAYINGAGWSHWGLASLARRYGLKGEAIDLSELNAETAFARLKEFLKKGPVIASVHYKFEPQNPIPHLAVITGVSGDIVIYNDPAADTGGKEISSRDFLKAWKKRFISFQYP